MSSEPVSPTGLCTRLGQIGWHGLIALAAMVASSCGEGPQPTVVRVAVAYDEGWGLTQMDVRVGATVQSVTPSGSVDVLLADEVAGTPADVNVTGRRDDLVVASGTTTITPVVGETVTAMVVLAQACSGETGCASPPASTCVDGGTLRTYSGSGTCSDGACAYASTDTTCPEGCSDGACVAERCTPTGDWTREVVDDDDTGSFDTTSLAVDELGQAHMVYFDRRAEGLRYASRPNARPSWSIETLENASGVDRQFALGVTAMGAVHVSYKDELADDLMSLHRLEPSAPWNRDTVDALGSSDLGLAGAGNDIVVGPDEAIHISHVDTSGDSLRYAFRAEPTDSWSLETAVEGGVAPFGGTSIALDSTGGVHVAYQRSDERIGHARRASAAASWETEVVDAEGPGGVRPSLAVDAMGGVHIAWVLIEAGTFEVFYAHRLGSDGWSVEAMGPGSSPSLAVDPRGGIHLVFGRGRELQHAFRPDPSSEWNVEPVDGYLETRAGAIAVDRSGGVHIGYVRTETEELLYAYRCM